MFENGRAQQDSAAARGGNSAPVHILVVDDEEELRELVRDYLVQHGFAVSMASGGPAMREILASRPVHVVVLDLNMPGEDGLTLARSLRQIGEIGIIMLTASAEVVDRVVGLELGADDYMAKPFDPRELLARVRALVRRLGNKDGRAVPDGRLGNEIRMGRCILNLENQRLFDLAGTEIPLTAMEFDLLRAFAERPNRVLSRDLLLELAHHRDTEAFDRSIDIRVMRLRKKIEQDPEKPQVIKTVRGAGYLFTPGGGERT